MRQDIARLQSDMDRYLMWKENPDRYPLEDEEGSRIEEVMYNIYYLTERESSNRFTAKIAASIGLIEDFLKPRLKI